MYQILKQSLKFFALVLLLISTSAFASSLTDIKAAGIIGEQANGYIGFVKPASDEVKKLVSSVNAKRKVQYQKIAKSKRIMLHEVEIIAGRKAMQKTLSGNYIKPASSDWSKKD
ncbi:MAG: YdbL family protein [Enterobacterales bacterium]|nr:YdbL family protein [Enterobacterales bacterium]